MRSKKNLAKDAMQELAEKALMMKYVSGINHTHSKPGEIIQNLGPVKKQVLKDLTSDDIKDVRWLR